ncbi:TPA: radical SAM/SPASM domain-containing protein [Vibrio parahaemolyticus]|uniref:radical SAM/SPASM domain-containing protein n=1 Tax=Vibrio parahaemolyticus TaxID=670 RepID=UPI001D16599D|nr:radical SAM protein [Vibrio parahaemolyticus]MCC3793687.1 radical SAM protein [Vibrio parahaemolyticus]
MSTNNIYLLTEQNTSRTTLAHIEHEEIHEKEDVFVDGYRITKPRFPISYQPTEASLYLTSSCNFSCSYCYIVPFYKEKLKDELSLLEWKNVLNELMLNGVRTLKLIGGEVLLYPHLSELISYADKLGFSGIELTTGGSIKVIKKRLSVLEEFKKVKAHKIISISLDSSDKNHHDKERGGHQDVIDGVKFLIEKGFNISLASVISKDNADDIENIALLAAEMGVDVIQFNSLVPIFEEQKGKVISETEGILETIESIESLRVKIPKLTIVNRFVPAPNINKEIFNKHKDNKILAESSLSGCPAGTREAYILPDGKLIACPMFIRYPEHQSVKTLKDSTFQDIWENDKAIRSFRNHLKPASLSESCKSCESSPLCKGGCRAMSHFLSDDVTEQDPRCIF